MAGRVPAIHLFLVLIRYPKTRMSGTRARHDDKTHSQMQHDARSVAMLMWASTKNSAPAKLRSN
jgi:hypothetical protein